MSARGKAHRPATGGTQRSCARIVMPEVYETLYG